MFTIRPILWLIACIFISVPSLYAHEQVTFKELNFIPNEGQWHDNVVFKANLPSGYFYAEDNKFTFQFIEEEAFAHGHGEAKTHHKDRKYWGHAYQINFLGANSNNSIEGKTTTGVPQNYFLGSDSTCWASNVSLYKKIHYHDLYDGIDAVVYSEDTHFKYDFIVSPRAKASDIKMQFDGLDKISMEDGNLIMKTKVNEIVELAPYAYQKIGGKEVPVTCHFKLKNKKLTFDLPDGYNEKYDLIIDPELIFASFSGSISDNWGYTATYDDAGNFYGGSVVFSSSYPVTLGAYQTTYGGGQMDMAITKYTPDGANQIYSTYLGGNQADAPHSLVVQDDELIIFGTTGSSNYPTTSDAYDSDFNGGNFTTTGGEYISYVNGSDIVVTRLNVDGDGLIGSTYLGGSQNDGLNRTGEFALEYNYGDAVRGEVIADEDYIYIASCTYSSNFPTTSNALEDTFQGDIDGCVAKFNWNLSGLDWCTFLGGDDEDAAYSLKFDNANNLMVCGGTRSDDFPTTNGALNTNYNGGQADGFIVNLSNANSNLINGTYIGTNSYDQCYFVETDDDGVYVVGQTKGSYPVSDDVYSNSGGKQFIHKLSNDLSTTELSTVFGSGGSSVNISPTAFLVDVCGNIYVSGWGGNVNQTHNIETGTTNGLPVTADALKNNTDGSDLYFFVLSPDAGDLVYGSFYGENSGGGLFEGSGEHVDGGTSRFNKQGEIYQAVCAGCGGSDNFPTTNGVWGPNNNSDNCNLGMIKIAFDLLVNVDINDHLESGCIPFSLQFSGYGDAETYFWDLGDGNTSDQQQPFHTYEVPGVYEVMLIGSDPATCNLADTVYTTVTVLDDSISANPFFEEFLECGNLTASFDNDSYNAYTHSWDLGDGTISNEPSLIHEYFETGTYDITYTVTGPPNCNLSDTETLQINIPDSLGTVVANFPPIPNGCIPADLEFISNSLNADSLYWDFGDGTTGTGEVVSHTYNETGTFTVTLIAERVPSCNDRDTISYTFQMFDYPTALFNYTPTDPEIETVINFSNLSSADAISYSWDFGDGTTSSAFEPTHFYEADGTYQVCLTVMNAGGCEDIYCDEVVVYTPTFVGIPNAFSPNGDGNNDILKVYGNGIRTIVWKVFNRWGEKVFESNNLEDTWDGTFRGVDQEMEVYVYTVNVLYKTKETFNEKGNLTLIR